MTLLLRFLRTTNKMVSAMTATTPIEMPSPSANARFGPDGAFDPSPVMSWPGVSSLRRRQPLCSVDRTEPAGPECESLPG
jgi:hypothetical protein